MANIDLKTSLITYSTNHPFDKVIKDEIIQNELDSLFPKIIESSKGKERKIKAALVILNLENLPTCHCGNPLEFITSTKANPNMTTPFGGWREFCSRKCSLSSQILVDRRRETNIERFGEISWAKTEEAKKISSEKWSDEKKSLFREKTKRTNLEKYGVTHHSKTQEYLTKRSETCLEKYGVENTFQLVDKIKQIKLEKYGYISWFSSPEGRDYMDKNNPRKDPATNDKIRLSFYQNRNHVNEKLRNAIYLKDDQLFQDIINETASKIGEFRKDIAEYLGISYSNLNFYMRLHGMNDSYVTIGKGTSRAEKELYDFVKSLCPDAIWGDRTILKPKEIDVYVPSKKIGIEMNGVYHHCEYLGGKDKRYHLNKTLQCEEQGIQLLHIFDTEWDDDIKKAIWKSIIKSKLGAIETKIYARKCRIHEVTDKQARDFYEVNHLSGYRKGAFLNIALSDENEIVSMLSLGKCKTDGNLVEIFRFANKVDVNVVGSFGKLIKACGYTNLMTFADRRLSCSFNSIYLNYFNTMKITDPNWFGFSTKDYDLKSRWNFTESKFKTLVSSYDDTITVFENMINNGYDRIYDSGNLKFTDFKLK